MLHLVLVVNICFSLLIFYSPTPVKTTIRPQRPTTTRRPGGETPTTTQSGIPSTTLYDPCEYMLQEIYERSPQDYEGNIFYLILENYKLNLFGLIFFKLIFLMPELSNN